MARTRQYGDPMPVVETPRMRARIQTIAEAEGLSQAEVVRQLLRMSITQREQISQRRLAADGAAQR